MKKSILLFIGVLSITNIFAQDIQDALRYSQDEIKGTARFRAMSGAFGALGGDLSALSINPAGSAIFNRSQSTITFSNNWANNDVSYFNDLNESSESEFDLSQAGVAFVFNNTSNNSEWGKFVFGFAYDQTQNYDDNWYASGTNNSSVDAYFLANAQGLRLDEISAFPDETISEAYQEIGSAYGFAHQQAFLGFESFILEPQSNTDDNTVYTSNVGAGSFVQDYSYNAVGYNGKFSFNFATQYGENIYLGLNLNSHIINYDRITYFFEGNSNLGSTVNEIGFENILNTHGGGFSLQLGGIAKVTEQLRLGLTYNSPTWLNLYEDTIQYISTIRDDAGTTTRTTIDPQVINVFPKYELQIPAKVTGSAAFIFNKKGLLSFDYSWKDNSKMKFEPENDPYFAVQNSIISDNLKASSTFKVGGEYRHKQLSFRGGYRFEESPYRDTNIVGNLTGFSLGLGINFGGTKLDLSYDHSERKADYQFFNVGFTDAATIDKNNDTLTLTLGFSL